MRCCENAKNGHGIYVGKLPSGFSLWEIEWAANSDLLSNRTLETVEARTKLLHW